MQVNGWKKPQALKSTKDNQNGSICDYQVPHYLLLADRRTTHMMAKVSALKESELNLSSHIFTEWSVDSSSKQETWLIPGMC